MKIFPTVKKRVVQIISGAVNWLARTSPAVAFGAVLTAIIGSVKTGLAIANSAFTLLVSNRAAARIVQVSFNLAHSSFIVTAAQDVGGTGTWANQPNAQGANNGTDSTIGGSAALLITGTLRGTMAAQVSRPASLVIDSVHLDFYGQVQGLPMVDDLVSRLVLGYRINTSPVAGADKALQTIAAGNQNFHSTPLSFRIDNGAGAFTDVLGTAVTWANIALIQPYFNASILLGLTGCTYSADAVKLRVNAHEVWTP